MNFGDPRLPQRFWDKCVPEPNSGCWLWVGANNGIGYGITWADNRRQYTHRVAFEALRIVIPDGMVIDHRVCKEPSCCNPAHLEVVTQRTNILRGRLPEILRQVTPQRYRAMVIAAAARSAAMTHCRRGHRYDEQNTIVKRDGSKNCRECRNLKARERYQETKTA